MPGIFKDVQHRSRAIRPAGLKHYADTDLAGREAGNDNLPLWRARGISGQRISSNSTTLTIESVTSIAPRRQAIVLRYGEHRLAVLTGGPRDISLGWLPPPSSSPLP
jgi:hypothetical protein